MREFLTILKVLWIVWVWEPLKRFGAELVGTAPCCEDPKWEWTEGHGFSVRICRNCGNSRTFGRNF